jgi:hypothetical protein
MEATGQVMDSGVARQAVGSEVVYLGSRKSADLSQVLASKILDFG